MAYLGTVLLNFVQIMPFPCASVHSFCCLFLLAKFQAYLKLSWCDDLADVCALYTLQFVFMNYTYPCVICISFTLYCILGGGEVSIHSYDCEQIVG